jgi:hypothetical protein
MFWTIPDLSKSVILACFMIASHYHWYYSFMIASHYHWYYSFMIASHYHWYYSFMIASHYHWYYSFSGEETWASNENHRYSAVIEKQYQRKSPIFCCYWQIHYTETYHLFITESLIFVIPWYLQMDQWF